MVSAATTAILINIYPGLGGTVLETLREVLFEALLGFMAPRLRRKNTARVVARL